MALLVEGLEVGGGTTIEEYVIGPQNMLDEEDQSVEKEEIKMMGPDGVTSMAALRVSETITATAAASRQSSFLVDPVVTLMDSVHEKLGDQGSTIFSQLGSMFSEHGGHHPKTEEWGDLTSTRHDEESGAVSECDDSRTPLISRQGTSMGGTVSNAPPMSRQGTSMGGNVGNVARSFSTRSSRFGQGSRLQSMGGEAGESTGIGGGWQLAWKWKEGEGQQGSFRRVYLHEDSAPGAWRDPAEGEFVKAAALVSHSAISPQQLMRNPLGPGMVRPTAAATEGPRLSDLLEPGVKNALLVGMGIQMMQQVYMIHIYCL